MDQNNNSTLIKKLEKSEALPPKLKEFLVLAIEEGAIEDGVVDELNQMLKKSKKQ